MLEEVPPQLPLTLHERYARPDLYGLFGISDDTRRTRHLNTGLSPQLPDGGYFIFITLDKGTIAYDCEDELVRDQLIWVTRRDRGENDSDYVALRQPGTRVSLFARRADKERFAYLGEVRWTDHEQFSNEGRLQQRYVLKLRVRVPDELLAELNGGDTQRSDTPTQPRPTTGPTAGHFESENTPASYPGRVSPGVPVCAAVRRDNSDQARRVGLARLVDHRVGRDLLSRRRGRSRTEIGCTALR